MPDLSKESSMSLKNVFIFLKGTVLILGSFFNGRQYFPPSLSSIILLSFPSSYKNDRDTAVSWRFHFFFLLRFPPLLFLASPGAGLYYIRKLEDFVTVHRQAPINVAFPG